MAIRTIRVEGDAIMTKRCKEVKEMAPRLQELVDDMLETLYDADGAGLAAPQVGVLKRIAVVDASEDGNEPYIMVNPEVLEADGEQTGNEGCLSVPGKAGQVTRPERVKIKAFDRNMQPYELEGHELLARAILHEIDHLEGILYVERVVGELHDLKPEDREE